MAVVNRGWLINFISGITGVTTGGNAVINLDVNKRYHELMLQCTAVNYTGGAGKQLINIKTTNANAAGATATITVVNGVITAAAPTGGSSGANYTTGDTVTPQDPTGTGAVLTVTAVGGAITALAVTVAGTPSATNPATVLTSVRLLVNGVNMRDITPGNVLALSQANGVLPLLGNLPIYFTAPWRGNNTQNELSSWDMSGQSTFQVQLGISGLVTSPGVTGVYMFDYNRNARPIGKGQFQAFLQPVSQHQFSFPLVAGRNDLNQLPFSYPVSRLWLNGSIPGNITQLEVYQDGNKILEATNSQILEMYSEWNFCLNAAGNTTVPNGNTLGAPFESAYISDPDQRPEKALSVQNSFIVRITTAVAQTITIVQEMLPGAYQS